MAQSSPAIAELTARDREEFPFVAIIPQQQLEHAMRAAVGDFTVALAQKQARQFGTAGSHHKFANSMDVVGLSPVVLRGEAFVVMIMAVEHDVGTRRFQRLPEFAHFRIAAVPAGTEERVVPISQRAARGRLCEICLQPSQFGLTGFRREVAIQRQEMPLADIKTVIKSGRRAGGGPEVVEIAVCGRGIVFMIAGRWMRTGLELAPGWRIAIGEFSVQAERIRVVADRQHLRSVVICYIRADDGGSLGGSGLLYRKLAAFGDIARRIDRRSGSREPQVPVPVGICAGRWKRQATVQGATEY